MRSYPFVLLLVALFALSSCRDAPTSPDASAESGGALLKKDATPPAPVPFHADIDWEILGWTMPPEGRCPLPTSTDGPFYMLGSLRGVGTATHMGRITAEVSHCIAPDFSFLLGEAVIRAAAGDQIRMEYDGFAGPNPELPDLFWVSHDDVTGGTGRFAGATGYAFEYGEATITALGQGGIPLAGFGNSTLDGWIAYDASYAAPRAARFAASGKLREGEWQVSFAGHVDRDSKGGLRGGWRTTLDHVSVPGLSGGTFVAAEMASLSFQEGDNPAECIGRANLSMRGTFEGEPGWSARVLAADAGSIGEGAFDTFRLVLYPPGSETKVYDTSDIDPENPGAEFPSVSDCNGKGRAEVDVGNVKIWMPD